MKEQINAVQRMQDYIEQNLIENITLSDLSEVSYFSPWYSHRIFKQYTNLTPADYIRRLRLSKSALRLRDEECKISDIAFDLGFGSVDGYQRAFFREFGCNPSEYAAKPTPLYLFTPFGVKYRELRKESKKVENIRSIFIQMIEKPARKIIYKPGIKAADYFAYCEEVGCDIWGLLTSMKSLCGEPVCMWLPAKYRIPGTSEYVQGVEVALDSDEVIPDGFLTMELPAAKYLMFQGEPFEEENYCQAIEELQAAIEKYNPEAIGYTWDDGSPRIQLEPIGDRGYIELCPVE